MLSRRSSAPAGARRAAAHWRHSLKRSTAPLAAPARAAWQWLGLSLARRFVATSLLLLLVVQFTSALIVDASIKKHARATLPEQLAMAARTTQSMLDWQAQRLVEGVLVLATDYGFRTAVQSRDHATIASVLTNHGARIGASEVALLTVDLKLIATAENVDPTSFEIDPALAGLARRANNQHGASAIGVFHGKARQMVLVPLRAPVLVGWVLMYFPLTGEIATRLHRLTAADLTVLTRDRPGQPWELAFSDLPAMQRFAMPAVDLSETAPGAMRDVTLAGDRLGIHTLSLSDDEQRAASPNSPQVLAVLSMSLDEALTPPRDLQIALMATTLLAFLTFGIASAWTALRVTTPLQSLAAAVRRLDAGDATTPLRNPGGGSEVSELARAFEAMRANLAAKQAQIVQSEKLASIGQLAAGVAHEINNPMGFVFSNFGTLEGYLASLFRMLSAYRSEEAALAGTPGALRLARMREQIELDYLLEDIPALMSESKDGIKRVRKIVQDLKDFSHVDASQQWEIADLHLGLDSTLNIVANEIRYKADIVKAYGELPLVECLPHELNQVFMNLLTNAAQAMGEERGRITLRTGVAPGEVWVEVEDNGGGIAPDDLKRIFDPFFTTKPVGKGTGLGLSLAYGIVTTHRGRIDVSSELGSGTRIRICIPATRIAAVEAPQAALA